MSYWSGRYEKFFLCKGTLNYFPHDNVGSLENIFAKIIDLITIVNTGLKVFTNPALFWYKIKNWDELRHLFIWTTLDGVYVDSHTKQNQSFQFVLSANTGLIIRRQKHTITLVELNNSNALKLPRKIDNTICHELDGNNRKKLTWRVQRKIYEVIRRSGFRIIINIIMINDHGTYTNWPWLYLHSFSQRFLEC